MNVIVLLRRKKTCESQFPVQVVSEGSLRTPEYVQSSRKSLQIFYPKIVSEYRYTI